MKDDALSELTALKQDAKSFRWRQMLKEWEKRTPITPLYWVAKSLLPQFGISQQNLLYFASLISFYTIYNLRNLKKEQTWLYLLCYIWLRYRQLSDNLISTLIWHMRQTEERCGAEAKKNFEAAQLRRQQDNQKLGRVLALFVDDNVPDNRFFGDVRQQAWKIMSRDSLQQAALQMSSRYSDQSHSLSFAALLCTLDFSSVMADCPWLAALVWIKEVFSRQQRLTQRPLTEYPTVTLPKRLRSWLLILDEKGHPVVLQADRYEFWLYRQLRKQKTV